MHKFKILSNFVLKNVISNEGNYPLPTARCSTIMVWIEIGHFSFLNFWAKKNRKSKSIFPFFVSFLILSAVKQGFRPTPREYSIFQFGRISDQLHFIITKYRVLFISTASPVPLSPQQPICVFYLKGNRDRPQNTTNL